MFDHPTAKQCAVPSADSEPTSPTRELAHLGDARAEASVAAPTGRNRPPPASAAAAETVDRSCGAEAQAQGIGDPERD